MNPNMNPNMNYVMNPFMHPFMNPNAASTSTNVAAGMRVNPSSPSGWMQYAAPSMPSPVPVNQGPSAAIQQQMGIVQGSYTSHSPSPVPTGSYQSAPAPWEYKHGDLSVNPPKKEDGTLQVQYENDKDKCGLCDAEMATGLFLVLDCGHFPFCKECLRRKGRLVTAFRCPSCRQPVTDTLQIQKTKPKV